MVAVAQTVAVQRRREKGASLYQQVMKALPCDKGDGGGRRLPLMPQQSTCVGVTTEQFPCLIRRSGKDEEKKELFIFLAVILW